MRFDHRRILATAESRAAVQAEIRPVVLNFCRRNLHSRSCSARGSDFSGISAQAEFPAAVESGALVEPTGVMSTNR